MKPEDLPCGGCHYCSRAHRQWARFCEDIDEAVGLSKRVREATPQGVHNKEADAQKVKPSSMGINKITKEAPRVEQGGQRDLLDLVVSCNIQGLGGSQAHFDIVTSREDFGHHISCCKVQTSTSSARNGFDVPHTWGYSNNDTREAQQSNKKLGMLLAWLEHNKQPSEKDLFLASVEEKNHWLNKEMYHLRNGVLFKYDEKEKAGGDSLLVIPESLKESAMSLHHDIPSSGHQGVARTKQKLKEKFYWFHMTRDIENYVLTCNVCNKNKKNKQYGKVPLTEFQAGAPMERVHIDFIGPLPKTKNGNEHCLMMVDQFTKWVECIPLPSQRAEETAKAAVDNFFSRMGFPFQILSDQGRNFDGKLFESLCKSLQIHKARTTPYRPSANGQVERFNRTLLDAVRCFLGRKQGKWDQYIQQIAMAMRASVNRSTGFTPNKLMLGREVNTPAQLMFANQKNPIKRLL